MSYIDSSGFKYRMNSLGIGEDALLVAYDFNSGSNFSAGLLNKPLWVTGSTFSGKLNGIYPNFYKNSGSGFFNGLSSVTVSGKIPSDDFAFLFCYEKLRAGGEVLLSSAAGSNSSAASGLTLGINDANKLYLEYWSPIDGKRSLDYEHNIGSKNLVFLSKSFGEFQLGIFDPIESSLSFSSISADSNNYSHSSDFIIGSGKNSFWSPSRNPFSGFMDDFYCVSGKVPNNYFEELYSGFFSIPKTGGLSGVYQDCSYVTVLSGSGVNLGTGITGYETRVTYTTGYVPTGCFNSGYSYLIGTGITGYEERYMGVQKDACDQDVPIYVRAPLTGNIYATGSVYACAGSGQVTTPTYTNFPLTGFLTGQVFIEVVSGICSGVTGYYPDYVEIDSRFVSSLGFDAIYSFRECENIIHSESYLYTGSMYSNINLEPYYDSVLGGHVIKSSHAGSGKNLFFNNGQLMLESGWSSYVQAGVTKYNITGNIFLDGTVLRSEGFADADDNVIYDNSSLISGQSVYLTTEFSSASNFNSLFSSNYPDYSVFLNGVKLVSGIDYNNTNLFFNIPASSVITKINNNYISSFKKYFSGLGNSFSLNPGEVFSNNSSQLYVNGLRQLIDYDYAEVSRYSILTGCPVPSVSNTQLVFSSLDDFWNI
jgi:hypothetical protein